MLVFEVSSEAPKLWKGRPWTEGIRRKGGASIPSERPWSPAGSLLQERGVVPRGREGPWGPELWTTCPKSVSTQKALPRGHTQAVSGAAPGSDSFCPVFSSSHTLPCGPLNPIQVPPTPGLLSLSSPARQGSQGPRAPPPHPLQSSTTCPLTTPLLLSSPNRSPRALRLRTCGRGFAPLRCPRHSLPATLSGYRALEFPVPAPLPGAGGWRGSAMTGRLRVSLQVPTTHPSPRVGWGAPLERSRLQPQPTHRAAEASGSGRTEGQTDTRTRSSLGLSPLAELAAAAQGRARRTVFGSRAGHVARGGQSGSPRLPHSHPSPIPKLFLSWNLRVSPAGTGLSRRTSVPAQSPDPRDPEGRRTWPRSLGHSGPKVRAPDSSSVRFPPNSYCSP